MEGWHLGALRTHHCGLEEAVEDVEDHRIVPLLVVLPGLAGHLVVGLAVAVAHLHVGLLSHPVQVLVQAVQQEGQQLLAVLLLVTAELRRKPGGGGGGGGVEGGGGVNVGCADWIAPHLPTAILKALGTT